MTKNVPLIVIGAGPAGLGAAAEAAGAGVETLLLDEQPGPGGQIYRAIARSDAARRALLGPDYARGAALLPALESGAVDYRPGANIWQITPEREVYFTRDGKAQVLQAARIVLATGAMERPMPFPGWTLPGVMTAGAAQIMLKSAGTVPQGEVVLAGSGPLLLLLASQVLDAGGRVAALVDTTPRGSLMAALPHLPGMLRAPSTLKKGLALLARLRRAGVPHYKGAGDLRARGTEKIEALRFTAGGREYDLPCALLLLHLGVVPNLQITRALGLAHDWDPLPRCWRPRLDSWGNTEHEGIAVAGDGGGIVGAEASEHQGRLAGLQAACQLGKLNPADRDAKAAGIRRALAAQRAARPFLDRLYRPAEAFLDPPDNTLVCRCEEVTAGQIRDFVRLGCLGPNQTKAFGRAGMGPCQGRFCGLTVSEVIARARGAGMEEVGHYRIRPPIKPVTLAELAAMDPDDTGPEGGFDRDDAA